MSDSMAQDQLRAFFERWRRLEDEKSAISGDLKELFAEAKGSGFDGKALRVAFRRVVKINDAAEAELNAVVDLYVDSLTRDTRVRAHVETIEEFDPETGELTEPAGAAVTVGNDLREPVAAEWGQIIREGDAPRETDRARGDASRPDAELPTPADSCDTAEPDSGLAHARQGEVAVSPEPGTFQRTDPPRSGAATREDAEFPAPGATRFILALRPHCQNPQACAGQGREHCFSCRKAAFLETGEHAA